MKLDYHILLKFEPGCIFHAFYIFSSQNIVIEKLRNLGFKTHFTITVLTHKIDRLILVAEVVHCYLKLMLYV